MANQMDINLMKVNIKEFITSIYKYYEKIFPEEERKPSNSLIDCYKKGIMEFYKVQLEHVLIGFMIIIKVENNPCIILDYFSIFPEYQGNGYGTIAIHRLKAIYQSYVITGEVEKPHDKDSERRIQFYERLDFRRLSYSCILYDVPYHLYACGNYLQFNDLEIVNYMFQIYETVYGIKKCKQFCKLIADDAV